MKIDSRLAPTWRKRRHYLSNERRLWLRLRPTCGTVLLVSRENLQPLMRPASSTPRMLAKTSRLIAPWLLVLSFASVTEAAVPRGLRHRTHAGARFQPRLAACNPRTVSLRKAFAAVHALGPVRLPSARAQAGLSDPSARLRRATRTKLDDNDAAIQNDAPAARIEHDDTARPDLRPLGLLGSSYDRLPLTSPFLPRSPRGPPAEA